MGQKQSTSKKDEKKIKTSGKKDDEVPVNGNSKPEESSKPEEEMHPSWDDEILFSKDGAPKPEEKKISKDDFELLTVIGKGSFGKVMQAKKRTMVRSML